MRGQTGQILAVPESVLSGLDFKWKQLIFYIEIE